MSLLAGLGRAYDGQRKHSARLDDEESRIRRLDALRSQDESAVYEKTNARRAQEAWTRMGDVGPDALPDAPAVPKGTAPAAPATPATPAMQTVPTSTTGAGYAPRRPAGPMTTAWVTPDQSDAESSRLARQAHVGTPRRASMGGLTVPTPRDHAPRNEAAFEELRRLNTTSSEQRVPYSPAPASPAAPAAPSAGTNQYDRATPYDAVINQAAAQHGLDPVMFKRLLGTESSFRPDAVSPKGPSAGLGIAQIAAVHGMPDAQRLDPSAAIPKAAQILKGYIDAAGGDVREGILKYKGATSKQGRDAMGAVYDRDIARVGATAPARPSTGPAANDAPAAQPETVAAGTFSTPAQRDPTALMRLRNERLREILRYTTSPQQQAAIAGQIQMGNFDIFEAQVQQAAHAAGSGDVTALARMASAVGLGVSDLGSGNVVVVRPAADGSGAVQYRGPAAGAAQQLYQMLSTKAQTARAAAQQKILEQQAQMEREMAVEGLKGRNAQQTQLLKGTQELDIELAKLEAQGKQVQSVQELTGTQSGRMLVTMKGGGAFVFVPSQDTAAGTSQPRLVAVQR